MMRRPPNGTEGGEERVRVIGVMKGIGIAIRPGLYRDERPPEPVNPPIAGSTRGEIQEPGVLRQVTIRGHYGSACQASLGEGTPFRRKVGAETDPLKGARSEIKKQGSQRVSSSTFVGKEAQTD